jgi:hypothetical protein
MACEEAEGYVRIFLKMRVTAMRAEYRCEDEPIPA